MSNKTKPPKPLVLHIDVKEKKHAHLKVTVDQATVDLIRQRSALGIVVAGMCPHSDAEFAFGEAYRRVSRNLYAHLGVRSLDDLELAVVEAINLAADIETRPLDTLTIDDLIAAADAIDPESLTSTERVDLDGLRAVLHGQD